MILRIAERFSRTPGSRYASEGEYSGETFRKSVLLPAVLEAMVSGNRLLVDLDGTAGYGTSFLEEAFGGLVRENALSAAQLRLVLQFKSLDEPYIADDIWSYIDDAEGEKV